MYHSPITLNYTDPIIESVTKSQDGYVVKAINNMGIEVDKEELVKALQYDRDQYYKGFKNGYELAEGKYIEGIKNLLTYNGLVEEVAKWEDWPVRGGSIIVPDSYGYKGIDVQVYYQLQALWVFAVSMFGDYGVSPRVGWIEDVKGFHKWIRNITGKEVKNGNTN